MRLDVRVLRAEELHCPVARKVLDLIDILAASVVARTGVALGIFIRKMAAHGLHHGGRNKVLRCDKLYMVSLALELAHHCVIDRGILLPYVIVHGFASVFCFPNDFTPLCCPWQLGKCSIKRRLFFGTLAITGQNRPRIS